MEENVKSNIEKLGLLLDTIRGTKDVRERLDSILNPRVLQTSSKLSTAQVNFVIKAYWLANAFPEFYEPLKSYANEVLKTMLSESGYGIESAIKLTGAIEQDKFLKALFGSVEKEKKPKFISRGKKE